MCRTITVFAAVLVLLSSETVRADDDYTDDDDNSPPVFTGELTQMSQWMVVPLPCGKVFKDTFVLIRPLPRSLGACRTHKCLILHCKNIHPLPFSGDSYTNGGWQFNIKESETGKNNQFIGVVEASDVSNCNMCQRIVDFTLSSFFFPSPPLSPVVFRPSWSSNDPCRRSRRYPTGRR